MGKSDYNVLIGGEAGQGLVTLGQLLTRSLIRSGYFVVVTQSYHSRIRGGHNTFGIRFSAENLEGPGEEIDLLMAMNQETVALHGKELAEKGSVLLGEALDPQDFPALKVPYRELSEGRYINVAAFGVAATLLGLEESLLTATLDDLFGKKSKEVVEKNHEALGVACRWARDKTLPASPPSQPGTGHGRLMLNGNEAIAFGALSAGAAFCSFYPMTPATSIPLALQSSAGRMGIVVEQVEDEIAAVNAAIGASFAGAPSLVATSGGGFALMVEGVSLAGMTETPLVIVVAQRPGPATGLPTRTEQGDLEFVLRSGHGEFPRAIFTPGTVEECFHLTRHAFETAELSQGPVFILTDQFLADSYRAVDPFAVEELAPVSAGWQGKDVDTPYRRYSLTDDGISPRLLPGMSKHLVIADSDEHTEEGHITEDLALRARMVDKRLKKGDLLRDRTLEPLAEGDASPEILLVSWGSSRGAILEAASRLRDEGAAVGTLHFRQVWPLVGEHFLGLLQDARRVVCVEGNATGQLARIIRAETGFAIKEKVLRYDGLPLTARYILEHLDGGHERER